MPTIDAEFIASLRQAPASVRVHAASGPAHTLADEFASARVRRWVG